MEQERQDLIWKLLLDFTNRYEPQLSNVLNKTFEFKVPLLFGGKSKDLHKIFKSLAVTGCFEALFYDTLWEMYFYGDMSKEKFDTWCSSLDAIINRIGKRIPIMTNLDAAILICLVSNIEDNNPNGEFKILPLVPGMLKNIAAALREHLKSTPNPQLDLLEMTVMSISMYRAEISVEIRLSSI